jgi:hypothetical protein
MTPVMRHCSRTLLVAGLLAGAAFAQAPGTVHFRFAFGAIPGGAPPALTAITQDTTLKTGDRIKLMVELQQPGFVYLIHRGPKAEIALLFPPALAAPVPVGRKHYVPEGPAWLTLDEVTGDETFYLLGSPTRLGSLETLLTRYAAEPDSGKPAVSTEIVAEIRRLRAEHRNVATPAERPVIIGGNVRSLDPASGKSLPDVSTVAVEITAGPFYARTFTVTHR